MKEKENLSLSPLRVRKSNNYCDCCKRRGSGIVGESLNDLLFFLHTFRDQNIGYKMMICTKENYKNIFFYSYSHFEKKVRNIDN